MAQTGYTPIKLYASTTASAVPLAGNLDNTNGAELAINITDGKLFYKDNAAAVQVIGWKTTPATAGGTGQTTYTTGDILYASATNTLSKLAAGSNGNVLTLTGGVPTWAASTGGVTSFSAGTTGLTPSTGTTGAVTLAGTLGTANGGTNLTSFTSGGAVYATSTSALTTGTLPVASGGTGLIATPTNGQIDIGNGSGFTRTTITAGTGISVTNGSGSITIASSGGGSSSGANMYLAVNFGGF